MTGLLAFALGIVVTNWWASEHAIRHSTQGWPLSYPGWPFGGASLLPSKTHRKKQFQQQRINKAHGINNSWTLDPGGPSSPEKESLTGINRNETKAYRPMDTCLRVRMCVCVCTFISTGSDGGRSSPKPCNFIKSRSIRQNAFYVMLGPHLGNLYIIAWFQQVKMLWVQEFTLISNIRVKGIILAILRVHCSSGGIRFSFGWYLSIVSLISTGKTP